MTKLIAIGLFTASLFTASIRAANGNRFHEDFHFSFPQTAGGHLTVENFNGSVEVTGWDQNTVDVSGTKYADTEARLAAIRVNVGQSGNTVRARTTRPDEHEGQMGAKYVIKVPRQTVLDQVDSSNGAVHIENIEGQVRLHTSNGSVRVMNVHGNVDATTSNGAVEARDVRGGLTVHTSNGGVRGEGIVGAFSATTSNGGIQARLTDTRDNQPIHLDTSNGSVDLELDTPRQNDVIASTTNGGITLRLPGSMGARVHAVTSHSGSIRSDFPMNGGTTSDRLLEGTIGSGGPRLDLSTSNGVIRLTKL